MKRKIAVSAVTILAVAAVVVGATTAFFSDTETSTGNVFAAGSIDLLIDNESYLLSPETGLITYNGDLSWTWDDLPGHLFFDYEDIKPGDYGEDTISIHVRDNDAWVCAAVSLTTDKDNTCTEPETADDPNCGDGNPNTNGDLADQLSFLWWADDSDNVLEVDEDVISSGDLGTLPVGATAVVTLVDSVTNIFGVDGEPFKGGVDNRKYIGKGWCFGDISAAPVLDDSEFRPNTRQESGFNCNGASVIDNASQTDSTTLDVSFYAVQARNNPDFECSDWQPSGPN